MADTGVSVVVVSRDRPSHLRRCLTAVAQLDHPRFEVIVVACPAGLAAAQGVPMPCDCHLELFDVANISRARNIGIALSRGAIVAFIDDDAVPEPTWLTHLAASFADPAVAQSGGTTLGRNGISVQHAAARADGCGVTHPVDCAATAPQRLTIDGDAVPRLHGTNMAIRRNVLVAHQGFDERFRFYLDETDLSRRICQAGGATVFAPRAVVHHASGGSAMRRPDRVPRSLYEIGASTAVFHRKHLPQERWSAARQVQFDARRSWLIRLMQIGPLTPDDVWRLLDDWTRGYAEGATRQSAPPVSLSPRRAGDITQNEFGRRGDLCLVGAPLHHARTRDRARQLVTEGNRVTVFELTATALYHRVRFTQDGYWHHRGGIFGRELRSEPLLQAGTREGRIARTLIRLEGVRSARGMLRKK